MEHTKNGINIAIYWYSDKIDIETMSKIYTPQVSLQGSDFSHLSSLNLVWFVDIHHRYLSCLYAYLHWNVSAGMTTALRLS